MVPDVEALVIAHLKAEEEVTDLVNDDRIRTRNPRTLSTPFVKVTQLTDPAAGNSQTDYLIEAHLQVECYGGADVATSQEEAKLLVRTVRQALHEMPSHTFGSAVVSRVKFGGTGSARVPDTAFEKARERYILDCFVHAHEKPAGS